MDIKQYLFELQEELETDIRFLQETIKVEGHLIGDKGLELIEKESKLELVNDLLDTFYHI